MRIKKSVEILLYHSNLICSTYMWLLPLLIIFFWTFIILDVSQCWEGTACAQMKLGLDYGPDLKMTRPETFIYTEPLWACGVRHQFTLFSLQVQDLIKGMIRYNWFTSFLSCLLSLCFFTKEFSRILILENNWWVKIKRRSNSHQSQSLILVKEKKSNLIK